MSPMRPGGTSVSVASCRAVIFSVGERVSFQPNGHPLLFATIVKYNRKTVTRITGGRAAVECGPDVLAQAHPHGAGGLACPRGHGIRVTIPPCPALAATCGGMKRVHVVSTEVRCHGC